MNGSPMMDVWQAEAMRETSRKQAIYSGDYSFIRLKLIDRRRMIISGVEQVIAHPYVNELEGGMTQYQLEVQGGQIKFEFDPMKNAFFYDMLDSDHNRSFLASHYHLNYWRIEDEKTDKEIAKASKDIEAVIKRENTVKAETRKEDPTLATSDLPGTVPENAFQKKGFQKKGFQKKGFQKKVGVVSIPEQGPEEATYRISSDLVSTSPQKPRVVSP